MKMVSISQFCIYLVLYLRYGVNSQLEVGDNCFHTKKEVNGICKAVENCPDAISDLKKNVYPQNCGFEGHEAIICCPSDSKFSAADSPVESRASRRGYKQLSSNSLPVGEKSRRACKSYEHLAYRKVFEPTGLGDQVDESICPWEKKGLTVIIGGEKAAIGEFPHMALIGYGTPNDFTWQCGGTLLTEKFVLTAAHCLFARNYGEPKFVRFGDLNHADSTDDKYAQQVNVKKYYKHPGYKFPLKYNDLAILELDPPVQANLYVKPACLYTGDISKISQAIITGWGTTENGTTSDYLLKATVDSYSSADCQKTFQIDKRTLTEGFDTNTQICFGSHTSNKDTCQGDSGGPIQRSSNDAHCSYDVFGVTSFGMGCGHNNFPAGYMKLQPYIKWIEDIVWP